MSIIKSSVFKFILYTACLAAISSCTDEIGQQPVPDRDDYLHFSAGIEKTRAETGQDGSGSFSEGDCIGVYIDNGSDIYYRELSFHNGEWQPLLKRGDFGYGQLTIYAHYPVVPGTSDSELGHYRFSVEADQKTNGTESSDLLVSTAELKPDEYDASLAFRHVMHRLLIKIEGTEKAEDIKVRSRLGGVVDLVTGDCMLSGEDFQWITPKANADGSFTFDLKSAEDKDLLWASARDIEAYTEKPVTLTFKHVMHRLIVNISTDPETGAQDINTQCTAKYKCDVDLAAGTFDNSATGKETFSATGQKAVFTLVPQPVSEVSLSITVGDRQKTLPLEEIVKGHENLESGMQLTVNITVKNGNIQVDGTTIEGWGDQGTIDGEIIM